MASMAAMTTVASVSPVLSVAAGSTANRSRVSTFQPRTLLPARQPISVFRGDSSRPRRRTAIMAEEEKRRFITREEEPKEYWRSADEKAGENPMANPLPWIAIGGLLSPFLILWVCWFNGLVKVPIR